MRVRHGVTATFDDPNLVSCAGLAPVLELAERAGLQGLVGEHVRIARPGGGNARLKVRALVAGMIAGADSIEDMGLLRHGAMNRLFTGVRAPSTLGTFLRTFTFGHVRQLDAVASRLLTNLCTSAPLLPGAHQLSYVDIDDTVKPTFGYAKQGAGRGYTGVKGLNAAVGDHQHPQQSAGDRRRPAPQGLHHQRQGRPPGRRRHPDHRPLVRRDRDVGAAGRLGLLPVRRPGSRVGPGSSAGPGWHRPGVALSTA